MLAGIEGTKRDSITREIINALGQWPEIERKVFSQVHYQGKSVEAISRSLQLDAVEVHQILKRCDRRLHASLRDLRERGCETPQIPAIKTSRPAA